MNGYLDNLEVRQVPAFKKLLILEVKRCDAWLEHIDVTQKFYGRTVDFFVQSVLKGFKARGQFKLVFLVD